MSTSDMSATSSSAGGTLTLPPGWTIGPGRETGQTNPSGQVIQGIVYGLTSPSGTTSSVFVPYSMIQNINQVQGLFDARTSAIAAIGG